MKKDYEHVENSLNKIKLLKNEITSNKLKKSFDKAIIEFKKIYDKLFYEAYFDKNYSIHNKTKLIEDLKNDVSKNPFILVCFTVNELNSVVFTDDKKYNKIKDLITRLKSLINKNRFLFRLQKVYIYDDKLILCVEKKGKIQLFEEFKKILSDYYILNINFNFETYLYNSSKTNKNLNNTLKKVYEKRQNNE